MSSHINKGHPRFAELDGLRALAVVSVILFHCEISGLLDAGFLGVDVFFTISGFIITAILVKEYRDKGNFRFPAFYFRRLKRLLPPVLGLVILAAFTFLISDTAFAAFRADVPAALAYMSNWWQIVEEQSYFDNTPRVLKHLWSLAVEEQFYLLWPPVAYCSLKRFGPKSTGVLALLLAFASTAWMWCQYDPAMDASALNRLYLGTDTHAMGLLAGAALACFWDPWSPRARSPMARWSWRIAALLSLGGLGYMIHTLNPTDPAVYRGGFLLVPLLTGVVAYCTMSDRRFFLSRLLRTDIVQWLGSRSYSLYLVHWLVFVWMRLRGFDDFSNLAVLAGGLALVAVLSELMYRWVEVPSQRFNPQNLDNRHMTACVVAYMVAAWSILAMTLPDRGALAPTVASAPAAAEKAAAPVQVAVRAPAPDEPPDPDEMIAGGEDIFAIGDSVLLGARGHLSKTIPGIRVDADVGRQASQGLKVVKLWRSKSGKASTILLHLGTNGYINEAQFRELLGELADRKSVIVINVRANRRWTAPNNGMIARLAPQFPNVRVIDWHGLASSRPEYFVKDGIHLTTKGMRALTWQIKAATGGAVIIPAERGTMLAKGNNMHDPQPAAPKAAADADKRRPASESKEASPSPAAAPVAKAGEEAADKAVDKVADPAPDKAAVAAAEAPAAPPPAAPTEEPAAAAASPVPEPTPPG
ncbi:MAG: hypothetical protein JWQ80_3400 [Massilia sp.]|nr:hypothetical protein [Massilia sp.]